MKRIRFVIIPILAASMAAAQVLPKAPSKTATKASTVPSATTAKKKAAVTRPSLYQPSTLKDRAPEQFRAKFSTTKGEIVVEVTRAMAPLGADRFYNLVKYGFYNGAGFFRVVPGFVVQFGLSAIPAVNAPWESAKIPDDPIQGTNSRGTLCFATSGPNTRTTQLFINLGENTRLDGMGFAAFGKVVEGMDVVDKIYAGYGERADQARITHEGAAYLKPNFPEMDLITKAIIDQPAAPVAPIAPAKTAPKMTPKTANPAAK